MFSRFFHQRLFGVLVLSAVLSGGCAYNPLNHAYDMAYPGSIEKIEACNKNVEKTLGSAAEQDKSGLSLFLDCVTGNVEVAETNVQLRMLRAHGIVAMLANYGTLNVKFDPDQQKENAANILHAVESAEKILWEAFTNPGNLDWKEVNALERIDKIVEVARIAAKPSARQYFSFFGSLISLTSPSPVSAKNILKDFGRIIKKIMTIDLYGGAYLEDIGTMVARADAAKVGTTVTSANQVAPYWKHFDSKLKKACDTLQNLAELDEHKCILAP